MSIDWTALGTTLGVVGTVATGIWAWWLKNQKSQANTRADVAESDAARTVADAQTTVYKLLNERLSTLESEVRGLRSELDAERKHSRRLELHIWRLEGLMRKAGIEPPAFHEDEIKAGGTA
jgi:hypothetical protein